MAYAYEAMARAHSISNDQNESKEWYNSLAFGDKEIVDEVMDNLSYEAWVESNIGEPEYLGSR